ncbi:MAG: hypothetical protein O2960_05625 [Verrucomicrobia bacterium]|nr:hypothetical protein [Verrucomicrobiota bacterium]
MNFPLFTHSTSLRLLLALLLCHEAMASEGFEIGVAKHEITPAEPVPMWGYGARHDALSDGVLDPLFATALVIHAGGSKLAVVGLDLGRSPTERSLETIRRQILAEAGIQHTLIAGSHTHHGPVLELSDDECRSEVDLRNAGQAQLS